MSFHPLRIALGFALAASLGSLATYGAAARNETRHEAFVGNADMEILAAISETLPGEEIPRHLHHGSEAVYVIQGAMVQAPGKDPVEIKTGADSLYARDVPHAGFKVVGDKSLKLYTVHVVDKGKPLYEPVAN